MPVISLRSCKNSGETRFRGRGRSITYSFLTVAGQFVRTKIRSARYRASSMLLVAKMTVRFSASQIRCSSYCNMYRVWASSAPKGSSINMTLGSLQ